MSDTKLNNAFYRPSGSLIIAARSTQNTEYDYKILLIKRTPRTAFATNHCVFPGGMFDGADESVEWLKYFKEFGVEERHLRELFIKRANPPPILSPQGNGCYDRFFKKSQIWARDITLRITAIREAFEEVGVLLCRTKDSFENNNSKSSQVFSWNFDRYNWQKWQNLVHNDATKFLELCKHLNVIPDLWGLYEWSVWRAPATTSRKYETVFYCTFLDEVPSLLPERAEVEEAIWDSPLDILKTYRMGKVWLPMIHYYELCRLACIYAWRDVMEFAYYRQEKGSTLFMPVYYRCEDALIGLLPGDALYPDDPTTFTETRTLSCSAEEFRSNCKKIHRLVYPDPYELYIDVNIPPLDGHLQPIAFEKMYSKL